MSEIQIQTFRLSVPQWAVLIGTILVFLVVSTGKVRYAEGDSRYSLLVSQSILQHGTVQLDAYQNQIDLGKLNNNHGWMVHKWEDSGHYYYFYPVGTSLLSLPFVWVGRRFGMDMLFVDHDTWMQILIAAFVLSMIFLQLYRLSRLWLDEWSSLAFSLLIVLGSSLVSTGGVALWSHNFETLAIVSVLFEVFSQVRGKRETLRPAQIGLYLFMAYLCRPTAMVFVAMVIAYVAWQHRPQLPKLLAWFGAGMALFVGWSFLEFGRPVPVYYDPGTWPGNADFFGNLLAILLSPGRGLWIYMPFVLLTFVGWFMPNLRLKPLWLLLWAWWLLHTIMIARSAMPWGGWCYGSRFYIDLVPGFAVMLLMMSEHIGELEERIQSILPKVAIALLGAGVYVHTIQGVYEPATAVWNDHPSIDERWAEQRWDWRYPQFMANMQSNGRRHREMVTLLPVGQVAARTPKESALLFGGPDIELKHTFAYWNETNKLKHWRVYNSLHAAEEAEEMVIWFSEDRFQEAKEWKGWHIDSANAMRSLGQFLAAEEGNMVLLSVQDEGSYKLSKESREYMRKRGSRIDSLKFRDSYAAIFDKGKLVWEDMGPKRVQYTHPGEPVIKLGSAGLNAGNGSLIEVGGKDYARHGRGFNVVVLGSDRTIVWSTNFDTHKADAEHRILYRLIRNEAY